MDSYKKMSTTICVKEPALSRDFYVEYFDAKVIFDNGAYIVLRIGNCELCFMSPMGPEHPLFGGEGVTYNLELDSIENVDSEHGRLTGMGVTVIVPLEDHPWGDRGFGFVDPNGVILYVHTPIEPAEEFKPFFK